MPAEPCGVFVAGTDTGVGKTMVAAALAAWCRGQRLRVGVMKPVATGGRGRLGPESPLVGDARVLAAAAWADDPVSLINPVWFPEPLAPWTAAQRAGRSIRLGPVLRAFRTLAAQHEVMIVEGAGGLLVPLSRRLTMAHLAQQFRLAVLLVARPGLGTLNHTLLSLECLRRLRLRCHGVVINYARPASREPMARLAERTNPDLLRHWAPVLGVLPHRSAIERRTDPFGAAWIAAGLGVSTLRRLCASTDRGRSGAGRIFDKPNPLCYSHRQRPPVTGMSTVVVEEG